MELEPFLELELELALEPFLELELELAPEPFLDLYFVLELDLVIALALEHRHLQPSSFHLDYYYLD